MAHTAVNLGDREVCPQSFHEQAVTTLLASGSRSAVGVGSLAIHELLYATVTHWPHPAVTNVRPPRREVMVRSLRLCGQSFRRTHFIRSCVDDTRVAGWNKALGYPTRP